MGLIGDNFTVTESNDQNFLLGAGLFKHYNQTFSFGVNAFYLAQTSVQGIIFQENLFDNLGYAYDVTHFPILITAKGKTPLKGNSKAVTYDVGVGPNIMRTQHYSDYSRDGGVSLPDNAFRAKTQTELAASAGIALRFENALAGHPVEIGYRFFYLGEGQLSPRTPLILNALHTGHNYAQSITVSTSFEG